MPIITITPVDWDKVNIGCQYLIYKISDRIVNRLKDCPKNRCKNYARCNRYIDEYNKAIKEYFNILKQREEKINPVIEKEIKVITRNKIQIDPIRKEMMDGKLRNREKIKSLHKYLDYIKNNNLSNLEAKQLIEIINRDSIIKIKISVHDIITPKNAVDRIKKKIEELGEENIEVIRG